MNVLEILTKMLSVVIVSFNSLPFLRKCLSRVLSQSFKDIEIIVVDNASVLVQCEMEFPDLKISYSLPFSEAYSQGIKPQLVPAALRLINVRGDRYRLITASLR